MRTRKATAGGEVPQQAPQQAAAPPSPPQGSPIVQAPQLGRGTDGNILGCAMAVGESSALCPSCTGACPDAARFAAKSSGVIAQAPAPQAAGDLRIAPSSAPLATGHGVPLPGVERAAQLQAVADPSRASFDAQGALDGTDQFVDVTWAEKTFCPVSFSPYKVGPFRASTRVRKGETIAQAMERLHQEIDAAARRIVAKETKGFLEDLAVACSESQKIQIPEGRR